MKMFLAKAIDKKDYPEGEKSTKFNHQFVLAAETEERAREIMSEAWKCGEIDKTPLNPWENEVSSEFMETKPFYPDVINLIAVEGILSSGAWKFEK